MLTIHVRENVGENCLSITDGQKLYDLIIADVKSGKAIALDFEGVKRFASPFFNFGLGQLFGIVDAAKFDDLVHLSNLNPVGESVWQVVRVSAERYYSDQKYRDAVDYVANEQSVLV
jgi:hypothetical protein